MEKITSVTVPLGYPVDFEGVRHTELTFRRMRAGDALVGEDENNKTMAGYLLFAALAQVPVGVIIGLDMDDLAEVGEKVAPLMGKRGKAAMDKAKAEANRSPGAT